MEAGEKAGERLWSAFWSPCSLPSAFPFSSSLGGWSVCLGPPRVGGEGGEPGVASSEVGVYGGRERNNPESIRNGKAEGSGLGVLITGIE